MIILKGTLGHHIQSLDCFFCVNNCSKVIRETCRVCLLKVVCFERAGLMCMIFMLLWKHVYECY